MFAVVETATGLVVDLLDEAPEITATGMVSPVRAQDIRTSTHSVVEAEPPLDRFLPCRMTLDNGEWTIPDQDAYDALLARLTPAPALPDLPLKKFRRALIEAGLFAGVEAAIDALDEPDRSLARNEFEYSVNIVRTDPWIAMLAPALALTDEEIDTLWTWAAGL